MYYLFKVLVIFAAHKVLSFKAQFSLNFGCLNFASVWMARLQRRDYVGLGTNFLCTPNCPKSHKKDRLQKRCDKLSQFDFLIPFVGNDKLLAHSVIFYLKTSQFSSTYFWDEFYNSFLRFVSLTLVLVDSILLLDVQFRKMNGKCNNQWPYFCGFSHTVQYNK